MKETILQIPEPANPRQVIEFLGTVGYCRLWILGFAEKAWVNGISWGLQTKTDRFPYREYYNGIIVVSQVLKLVQMYSIGPNPVEQVHATLYPTTSLPTSQGPTKDPEAGPLAKLGQTDPL